MAGWNNHNPQTDARAGNRGPGHHCTRFSPAPSCCQISIPIPQPHLPISIPELGRLAPSAVFNPNSTPTPPLDISQLTDRSLDLFLKAITLSIIEDAVCTCPLAVCWRQTGSFRRRELSRIRSLPLHRPKQHASPSLCISTTLRSHCRNLYPSFETGLPSDIHRRILYAYRCLLLRVLIANLFWVSPHLCKAYITYLSSVSAFFRPETIIIVLCFRPAHRLCAPSCWRQLHGWCASFRMTAPLHDSKASLRAFTFSFHDAFIARLHVFAHDQAGLCTSYRFKYKRPHLQPLHHPHSQHNTFNIQPSTLFCILFQAQHICAPRTDRYNYKRLQSQSFTKYYRHNKPPSFTSFRILFQDPTHLCPKDRHNYKRLHPRSFTTHYQHNIHFLPHSLSRPNTSVPRQTQPQETALSASSPLTFTTRIRQSLLLPSLPSSSKAVPQGQTQLPETALSILHR